MKTAVEYYEKKIEEQYNEMKEKMEEYLREG